MPGTGPADKDSTSTLGASPLAVDRREAARLLGVSPGTVDNLRLRGELPSLKNVARRLYAVADLAAFIGSRREMRPSRDGNRP